MQRSEGWELPDGSTGLREKERQYKTLVFTVEWIFTSRYQVYGIEEVLRF